MANSFYNEDFQGQAGQTARADHVESELSSIGAAFDAIEEIQGRALRAPEGEDALTFLPAVGARSGRFLRFDEDGNPQAVQTGFTWRGDWAAGTLYQFGDVVREGRYGSLYICTAAHTSGATRSTVSFGLLIDLQGLNLIENEIKTSSFTAEPAGDYMIDTSGGDVVVTLPAVPSINDAPINITLIDGDLTAGQTLTIARNGNLIMGLAEDLVVDTVNASFALMWSDAARGWRLRVLA